MRNLTKAVPIIILVSIGTWIFPHISFSDDFIEKQVFEKMSSNHDDLVEKYSVSIDWRASQSDEDLKSLEKCLFDVSDVNSFRWRDFGSLSEMEVCLVQLHNHLNNLSASVEWFEDQGFSVTVDRYERSPGIFNALIAQWKIPKSGEKSPLRGFREWFRTYTARSGMSVGLNFDPSGRVIYVSSGYTRK